MWPDEWAAVEGCTLELTDVAKPQVEAASRLDKGFVRKRKAVARVYDGTCPEHGRVAASRQGHHIDTKAGDGEGAEGGGDRCLADKPWQEVAFAVAKPKADKLT